MAENTQVLQELDAIKSMIVIVALGQKKALTFKEACIYSGRSESDMYKRTSNKTVPHYCAEGKMIYFDREELEDWMLRNPIKTTDQISRDASTYVALNKKKTVKSI